MRPSIMTSKSSAKRPLYPREVTDHLFESMRATDKPGAMRSSSGMLLALERRISSWEMTKTAAGVSLSVCGLRETVDIFVLISSVSEASVISCFNGIFCPAIAVLVTEYKRENIRRSQAKRVACLLEVAIINECAGCFDKKFLARKIVGFGIVVLKFLPNNLE